MTETESSSRPPWLYRVPAVCDCGTEHEASTLVPPVPDQPPIRRKCDPCIEAGFRGQPKPKAAPAPQLEEEAPDLAPPRKVFGYDD